MKWILIRFQCIEAPGDVQGEKMELGIGDTGFSFRFRVATDHEQLAVGIVMLITTMSVRIKCIEPIRPPIPALSNGKRKVRLRLWSNRFKAHQGTDPAGEFERCCPHKAYFQRLPGLDGLVRCV